MACTKRNPSWTTTAYRTGNGIPIRVKVTVSGDEMEIDLSEVAKQVKGFYNSGEAAGQACCQVAFKCLTSALEKPINEGSFQGIEDRAAARPGSSAPCVLRRCAGG